MIGHPTFSRCGFCDAKNRRSHAGFECSECGWTWHADHNAARNIAAPGVKNIGPPCQPCL
ncbi:zinc ribbon domain-containing protein [Rhodococcus sp. ARC_M6]|uniref:zinc ribbon domain-containing protein n=1 Tax=Rhodococcus sp. ARC_M6 TaxID=2928852 RepID=UPI0027E005D2|nr:zinc ribbon domain-containing protein [Rhodococcus sp. ARC_M6]